jgi:hypothetical protein
MAKDAATRVRSMMKAHLDETLDERHHRLEGDHAGPQRFR